MGRGGRRIKAEYAKKCWACGSQNTFITTPLPYDETDIIYVACCHACTSWSFVREPKTVQRIKRMLYEREYNLKRNRVRRQVEVDDTNVEPNYTMDFTLDNE